MKVKIAIGIGLMLPLCFVGCADLLASWKFSSECSGWLYAASNATNIPIARDRLGNALKYVEDNNLTQGSCHWFWSTPNTDLNVWYSNLKAAHTQLSTMPTQVTPLEESNSLMKLRETLTDQGQKGTYVVKPNGICWHPYWSAWCWLLSLSCLLFIAGLVIIIVVTS